MLVRSSIGVGLRYPHYQQVLEDNPPIDWFEVHSENFLYSGSPARGLLRQVREHYPISLHGVGLSLGSADGVCFEYLERLKSLMVDIQPFLMSEHLSWGKVGGVYLPDLLPVPYTTESLNIFTQNVEVTQDFLGRAILIENPSSYLEYGESNISEIDFLVMLCQKTGAKILLDVNNVFVSSHNHGWDPEQYIDAIPNGMVGEIHIAGHSTQEINGDKRLYIDTHDQEVCPGVWALYEKAVKKFGPIPTLLEWDAKIPELSVLMQESKKALQYA